MIYLDYNSTSPMLPGVFEVMKPFLMESFGNSSSPHQKGREVKNALEIARENISKLINVKSENIVFTSGASESINTAIKGVVLSGRIKRGAIITSTVEHSVTYEICKYLENEFGFLIKNIPVSREGKISIAEFKKQIDKKTKLVTLIHAQNEIGIIEPVEEIGKIAKKMNIVTHFDGAQAVGKIKVDLKEIGVDLYSFSSHKMGGPKGVGALYIREGIKLYPIIHGGHQERNRRGGTENIAAIAGFGEAARILIKRRSEIERNVKKLKVRLYKGLLSTIDRIKLNGAWDQSLPNTLNLRFDGVDGMTLLMNLDIKGICISTGSACLSGGTTVSPSLLAIGLSEELAKQSIRFSLGWNNHEKEIDKVIKAVKETVERLRGV